MRIINVMASSLNGRIGASELENDAERQKVGVSSPEDHQFLLNEIKQSDAIVVGATSIRANGQCLDQAGQTGKPPAWFILSTKGLASDLPFWRQSHVPRFLISPHPLPIHDPAVTNWVCKPKDLAFFTAQKLRETGMQRVLLFGGGIVNRIFYEAGLVDELKLTLSPVFIAGTTAPFLMDPALAKHVRFRLVSSHQKQSFVFLNYELLKN